MLLEAVKASGIDNVREGDFYLALVQDSHVRIVVLSMSASYTDIFLSKGRFSGSPPGTQAVVRYPSSHMPRHLKGLRSR